MKSFIYAKKFSVLLQRRKEGDHKKTGKTNIQIKLDCRISLSRRPSVPTELLLF